MDLFAVLNQPRRPWLDPEAVQGSFISLSSAVHPDRVHNASEAEKSTAHAQFTALNHAWQVLRDPKGRIQHLLGLETGRKPGSLERLPSRTMDYYLELGQVCGEFDRFLADRKTVVSPLFMVRSFEKGMSWRDRLESSLSELNARLARLVEETKGMNASWDAAPAMGSAERECALPLERLEEIYREISYASRWLQQVRERLVQI
jgi:curved DNA-binding protein CbpA